MAAEINSRYVTSTILIAVVGDPVCCCRAGEREGVHVAFSNQFFGREGLRTLRADLHDQVTSNL
jgi:hypothetical protein